MNDKERLIGKWLGAGMGKEATVRPAGKAWQEVPIKRKIYAVEDIWSVAGSKEPVVRDLDDLKRFMKLKVWGRRTPGGRGNYSPSDLLRAAKAEELTEEQKRHLRRIDEADLNHPVILFKHEGRIVGIPDGFHRLAKAIRDGRELRVVEITDDDLAHLTPLRARHLSKTAAEKMATMSETPPTDEDVRHYFDAYDKTTEPDRGAIGRTVLKVLTATGLRKDDGAGASGAERVERFRNVENDFIDRYGYKPGYPEAPSADEWKTFLQQTAPGEPGRPRTLADAHYDKLIENYLDNIKRRYPGLSPKAIEKMRALVRTRDDDGALAYAQFSEVGPRLLSTWLKRAPDEESSGLWYGGYGLPIDDKYEWDTVHDWIGPHYDPDYRRASLEHVVANADTVPLDAATVVLEDADWPSEALVEMGEKPPVGADVLRTLLERARREGNEGAAAIIEDRLAVDHNDNEGGAGR